MTKNGRFDLSQFHLRYFRRTFNGSPNFRDIFFKSVIDVCGLDREELSYQCGQLTEASS